MRITKDADVKNRWISIPLWCDYECPALLITVVLCTFQFHFGAIMSVIVVCPAGVSGISIPLWCDYENTSNCSLKLPNRFQFHFGAIMRWWIDQDDKSPT